MIRTTYTFALMELPVYLYGLIRDRLEAAGYDHAINPARGENPETIDMHGIALVQETEQKDKIELFEGEREALMAVTASLAAAISLLEKNPQAAKAAPSNTMYAMMLKYSNRTLEQARMTLHALAEVGFAEQQANALNAAIQYAITADEGLEWLRAWNEGNFEACKKEWPDSPKECY